MTQRCETCIAWKVTDAAQGLGECHHYAPRPVLTVSTEEILVVLWPPTAAEEGCGEWRPKPVGNLAAAQQEGPSHG